VINGLNKAIEIVKTKHEEAKSVLALEGHDDNLYWLGQRNVLGDLIEELEALANKELEDMAAAMAPKCVRVAHVCEGVCGVCVGWEGTDCYCSACESEHNTEGMNLDAHGCEDTSVPQKEE